MKKKISPPLLGTHISIAGGLYKSIERAQALGCTTMQIFTKNSRSWFAKPLSSQDVEKFKTSLKASKLKKIMAHSTYLINIASTKPDIEQQSTTALKHELHRCEELEIPYLVHHPGSHLGAGEEKGIKKVCKNLDKVLATANGKTMILLETMAGQGTNLGYTFEQIKAIYAGCTHKKLIGVCLDTCHLFAAGYDLTTPETYEKTMKKFARIVGLQNLKAIHLNDSKTEFGSRKDRHESIGKGQIPQKAFEILMQDKRLTNIPKVLETPDPSLYTKELRMLTRMAG